MAEKKENYYENGVHIEKDLKVLAESMIESAANSIDVNEYGDKHGDYFMLAEDDNGEAFSVAATEISPLEPSETPYYTIHVIDDINFLECGFYHTDDLSVESVVETLTEIKDSFVEEYNKRHSPIELNYGELKVVACYANDFHVFENGEIVLDKESGEPKDVEGFDFIVYDKDGNDLGGSYVRVGVEIINLDKATLETYLNGYMEDNAELYNKESKTKKGVIIETER